MIEVYIKALMSLSLGLLLFLFRLLMKQREFTGFTFKIEPLLICLIGGAFVVNHNKSQALEDWKRMCQGCAPYIYCTFFTLGGGSINLNEMGKTQMVGPFFLVMLRLMGIVCGTMLSGFVGGDPWHRTRLSWMNYITQAGVALGFANETLTESAFDKVMANYIYTLTLAVIAINQVIGPPFFKLALRLSGEAFIDRIGGAQLITVEGQVPQIQIKKVAWEVRAGARGSRVAKIVQASASMRMGAGFDDHHLLPLLGEPQEGQEAKFAFISMLEDDTANYEACKLAQRLYKVRRCIVQQIDPAWKSKFNEIGGLVVDPASIVAESLEQFLGSAQAAAMLLHNDCNAEVVKVAVNTD